MNSRCFYNVSTLYCTVIIIILIPVYKLVFRGKFRILYLTPEYATTNVDLLHEIQKNVGKVLIVINNYY